MVGGAGRDVDDLDQAGGRMIAAELQRPAFLPNETSQRVIAGLGGNGADAYGAELALLPVEPSVYEQPARTVAASVDPRQRVRETARRLPARRAECGRSGQRRIKTMT